MTHDKTPSFDLIERLVRPEIQGINAYHVQDASGLLKLDAMENPHVWSSELQHEWLERLASAEVNRYPDPHAQQVVAQLGETMNIPAAAGVVLGNGSDELIQILSLVLAGHNRKIMAPTPTFVMYDMIAKFVGSEFVGVPLTADFQLDIDVMLNEIRLQQPALVFLAYPNNPTGAAFKREDIQRIIDAAEGVVVIDEAYHAFAGDSYLSDVLNYQNVIVMRTLSKLGLAGLRFGFMAGHADLMNELEKVRLPYNINVLTQLSVEFALENIAFFDSKAADIVEQRAWLTHALSKHDKVVEVYPSDANFILFKTAVDATQLHSGLKARGVLIKNMHKDNSPLANCLRVTVSTAEENQQFLNALSQH